MKDFEEFLSLVKKRTEQRKKAEASGQPQCRPMRCKAFLCLIRSGKTIAAGLTSAQARRAAESRVDTLLELKAQDWAIDSRVTREHNPDAWRRWQEIKAARRK